MAQKTPLPAKTVMYADRWNSTWFVDLENFRTQLMEDYHLRFLLTGFLRLKKQWLYLLSIHKSGGFYFFQVITLKSISSSKVRPLLEPTDANKNKLTKINFLMKKSNLLKNYELASLKLPKVAHWKDRMPYKKSLIWTKLQHRIRIFKHGYFSFPYKKSTIKTHVFKRFMRWNEWMNLNHNKITLNYYNSYLNKFFYKPKTSLNLLLDQKKSNNSLLKLKLTLIKQLKTKVIDKTKNVYTVEKKENNNNEKNSMKKHYNKYNKKSKLNNKRNFSTLNGIVKQKFKIIKNNNNNLLKTLYKKKLLKNVLANRLSSNLIIHKKYVNLYKMIYRVSSYFYKRMFRYKKYPTIKMGYRKLYKKYGYSLKYTHMLRRLGNSMLFICKAITRVTAMQCYVYYLPMEWYKNDYKFLRKAVVFERYCHQKSFVPSVALLHLAMSRGSANLITDLLVRKLRRAFVHLPFLGAVEQMCRYFMAPYESDIPFKHSLCKGIEITFKGKLNGGDRSKTWRFKLGPVHTSTFYTNTREQVAKCVTRYGVFSIRVRLKLGEMVYE